MKRHALLSRIDRLVWDKILHACFAAAGNGKFPANRNRYASPFQPQHFSYHWHKPDQLARDQAPSRCQVSPTTHQSHNLAINWPDFAVAVNKAVSFAQSNAFASAFNCNFVSELSRIFGRLSADKPVFILDLNGAMNER